MTLSELSLTNVREMYDGLYGSQKRGVPSTFSNYHLLEKCPWLGSLYIYPVLRTEIVVSQFLDKVIEVTSNTVEMSKTSALELKKYILGCIPEDGRKAARIIKIEKVNFSDKYYYFITKNSFFNDVIQFCLSEFESIIDIFPDFLYRFNFTDLNSLFFNTIVLPAKSLIKVIKFHTASFMAKYLHMKGKDGKLIQNQLPPEPDCLIGKRSFLLWSGNVKRFLKNKLNTKTDGLKLSINFLQGIKRACAVIPESFLYESVVDHVIAMSTLPSIPAEKFVLYDTRTGLMDGKMYSDTPSWAISRKSINPLKVYFQKSLSALSRPKSIDYLTRLRSKIYEPSHNSSFEKSRAQGGAYSEIIETLNLPILKKSIFGRGEIINKKEFQAPEFDIVKERAVDYQAQINSKNLDIENDNLLIKEFKEAFPKELSDLKLVEQVKIKTTVIPLKEPIKVRVITKSEALPMYYSKGFQKSMKEYIDRYPQFVLTTRPLMISDFDNTSNLLKKLDIKYGIFSDFKLHVSGDYKAATDNLNINFTKLIFEELLVILKVPEPEKEVYRSVLYEQHLYYPAEFASRLKEKFPDLDVTPNSNLFSIFQKNGQLMGSILSFPVLCLANLLCYHKSMLDYIYLKTGKEVKISLSDLPVLINGDDIYFKTNEEFYDIWFRNISKVGFKLSVGKNYVHPTVFTINSTCFTESNSEIKEIGYLNNGLLCGFSKSGSLKENPPLWDIYNKLISGANNPINTFNRFLYYHKDDIRRITSSRKGSAGGDFNLFLPLLMGGCGFNYNPEIPVSFTRFQYQVFNDRFRLLQNNVGIPTDVSFDCLRVKKELDTGDQEFDNQEFQGDVRNLVWPFMTPYPDKWYKNVLESSMFSTMFSNTYKTNYLGLKLRNFRLKKKLGSIYLGEKFLVKDFTFCPFIILKEKEEIITKEKNIRTILLKELPFYMD